MPIVVALGRAGFMCRRQTQMEVIRRQLLSEATIQRWWEKKSAAQVGEEWLWALATHLCGETVDHRPASHDQYMYVLYVARLRSPKGEGVHIVSLWGWTCICLLLLLLSGLCAQRGERAPLPLAVLDICLAIMCAIYILTSAFSKL